MPATLTGAVAAVCGSYHNLALRADGTVVGWGRNDYGQATSPARLDNVVAIAAGASHSLALTAEGRIVGWGYNYDGAVSVPAGLSNVVAIGAGGGHSLALTAEGRLVAWGANSYNQATVPAGLSNVVAVGCGSYHNLALRTDGTVVGWGMNTYGQTKVPAGLSNVVAVAAGYFHSLALKADGTVVAWGAESGTNVPTGLSNVVAVAAGQSHSLALKADGRVLAWGFGTETNVPAGLSNMVAVSAAWHSSLALASAPVPTIIQQPTSQLLHVGNSALFRVAAIGQPPLSYQWRANGTNLADGNRLFGANTLALTLTGTQTNDAVGYSVVVTNLSGSVTSRVVTLLSSLSLADALNTTSLTWSTGGDAPWFPQAGISHDGTSAARSGIITNLQTNWIQTTIAGPGVLTFWWKVSSEQDYDFLRCYINGVQVAAIAGAVDWQKRSFYLGAGTQTVRWMYTKDELVSWGSDAGRLDEVSFVPGKVPPLVLADPQSRGLALGQTATLAVCAAGPEPISYQWFKNGETVSGATNVTLPITGFQAADAGLYSVALSNRFGAVTSQTAVITETPILAWGSDSYGQVTVPAGLSNVLAVACGESHTMALRSDGTVIVWGRNYCGQTNVPTGLTNVVGVAAGPDHCLALRADGTVAAWGEWWNGQTATHEPVSLPSGLSNVVAVGSGKSHALALKADGTVVAWGIETYGNPTAVPPGLSNVVVVGGGGYHSLALRADGSLAVWGGNNAGQTNIPAELSNVVSAASGGYFNLALRADGTVVAWGINNWGQTNVPADLSNVVAVASGSAHSLALRADGTVAAWGANSSGQTNVPVGLSNVIAVAGGWYHTAALVGSGPRLNHVLASSPIRNTSGFSLQVPTQADRVYALEYKQTLMDSNWAALPLVAGNGCIQTLTDTNAPAGKRFYRVRGW